jgi:hypothetical protein
VWSPSTRRNLKFTGIVNGAERWASDDGAMVEYRVGTGRLNFHAWKKHTIYQYWSMGGVIGISGTYTTSRPPTLCPTTTCRSTHPARWSRSATTDRNDSCVDQYEWGINAQQPERVAALCRAQWNNARFADS